MREPTNTIHRVYFHESKTAFQAHVLFPLEVSVRKLSCINFCHASFPSALPGQKPLYRELQDHCVTATPPFLPHLLRAEHTGTLLELLGKKNKSKKHPSFAKAFHFPLNKSCFFMNALSKVNN